MVHGGRNDNGLVSEMAGKEGIWMAVQQNNKADGPMQFLYDVLGGISGCSFLIMALPRADNHIHSPFDVFRQSKGTNTTLKQNR